jgi:hypothetical protein
MNLDDELRAVLDHEAERQTTSLPDVERLIVGGRTRRRHRTVTRALVSGLAVVLIGSGAYAVTQDRSEPDGGPIANTSDASGVDEPPTLAGDDTPGDLASGTYRIHVGSDAARAPIQAELTFEGPGWGEGDYPVLEDGESLGGVGAYQPIALGAASGCATDVVTTNLADTPWSLAQQLAALPHSTLEQPVEWTTFLGRRAVHLRLRIPQTCPGPVFYRIALTPRGSRGITFERPDGTFPPVIVDFWVMELEGRPLVVDTWYQAGTSAETIDRIAQVRDSITFVTDD